MRKTSLADMHCAVARTLDVVGEWWTLLIVRDAFLGARRFEDFREVGIADNILAARLKRLVEEEILVKVPYQDRPVRYEYLLTAKGRDLGLVIAAMKKWGGKWTGGGNISRMRHAECGHAPELMLYCEHCRRAIDGEELRVERVRPARVA